MEEKRTIKDLTTKELFEDLEYYVNYAQTQSPPFVDLSILLIFYIILLP